MPYTTRRGVRIYFELTGKPDGPPLVLVRGLARSSRYWLSFLDDVSAHFRVLLLDNRGVDAATHRPCRSTHAGMDDDVAEARKRTEGAPNGFGILGGAGDRARAGDEHPQRSGRSRLGAPAGERAHRISHAS